MHQKVRHQAVKGILDREFAVARAKELIDKWSPYITELVNYSTGIFSRCEQSLKGIKGTPSSIILLYYHVIQMADGIEVSTSRACFTASVPMLRSLWEACLSIEYIVQDDFDARSSAWMAYSHAKSKAFLETLDPTTQSGKKILALRNRDKLNQDLGEFCISPDKVSIGLEQVGEKLSKDEFREAIEKITNDKGRLMNWYSVNNGPRSLEQLAFKLGKPLQYEYLYRYFSEITHAQNISRAAFSSEGGHFITPIRDSSNAETVFLMTANCLIDATTFTAGKLRPEEPVSEDITDIVRRHRPEAFVSK